MLEEIKEAVKTNIKKWAYEHAQRYAKLASNEPAMWLIDNSLQYPIELMLSFKISKFELGELNNTLLTLMNLYINDTKIDKPYYFTYREPRVIKESNDNYFVIVTISFTPIRTY